MKLVLIDRDGVINEELPHYVKSEQELKLFEHALEGIALLTRKGFTCAVATNQSVVGRGIIAEATLHGIHDCMIEAIRARGGNIEAIYACFAKPDENSEWRKPKPGMLLEALKQFGAAAESTPFIGDAVTDMEAAYAAGCPRYLVMTGKGKQSSLSLPETLKPVTICNDLLDAAGKIVETFG